MHHPESSHGQGDSLVDVKECPLDHYSPALYLSSTSGVLKCPSPPPQCVILSNKSLSRVLTSAESMEKLLSKNKLNLRGNVSGKKELRGNRQG